MVGNEIQTNTDVSASRMRRRRSVRERYRRRKELLKARFDNAPEKMHGAGFLIIVLLAAGKDMFDVLADFSVIFSVFATLASGPISLIIALYLWYNDTSFTVKQIATWATMLLIELIPFINLLPATVVSLYIIRFLENNEQARRIAAASI